MNTGLSERNAGPHHSGAGQQQPADTIAGYREGDDRADHRDSADDKSKRQRVGKEAAPARS